MYTYIVTQRDGFSKVNRNQFTFYCCLSLCDWKVQYLPDYPKNCIGRNSEKHPTNYWTSVWHSTCTCTCTHTHTHTHTHTDMLEEVSVLGPGYHGFLFYCQINIKEQMRLKLRKWNLLMQLEKNWVWEFKSHHDLAHLFNSWHYDKLWWQHRITNRKVTLL